MLCRTPATDTFRPLSRAKASAPRTSSISRTATTPYTGVRLRQLASFSVPPRCTQTSEAVTAGCTRTGPAGPAPVGMGGQSLSASGSVAESMAFRRTTTAISIETKIPITSARFIARWNRVRGGAAAFCRRRLVVVEMLDARAAGRQIGQDHVQGPHGGPDADPLGRGIGQDLLAQDDAARRMQVELARRDRRQENFVVAGQVVEPHALLGQRRDD